MKNYSKPEYFINRELSWLEFDQRVLDEARDTKSPLLERAKFIAITLSNLDEFFMVRVAGIMDQIHDGFDKKDPAGLSPLQQKTAIAIRTHELMNDVYAVCQRMLLPALRREGFLLADPDQLTAEDHIFLKQYFEEEIFPVLTPMGVDPSRPFPLLLNKSLNIALLLNPVEEEDSSRFATVQVPGVLPRLVKLPDGSFLLMEDLVRMFLDELFPGQTILTSTDFRITRSGEIDFQEEEAVNLLKEMERSLKARKRGEAVRLEIRKDADPEILTYLKNALSLEDEDVYETDGPVDISFIAKAGKFMTLDHLKKEDIHPQIPGDLLGVENLFDAIRERDILMHHPYESFQPVVRFLQDAADDPSVLAIKQTLYRVSGNSPIISALAKAAENGKPVTVLVEVKARFDEENNIQWARKLEKAGCHVVYGLVGLKTHCKLTIVVRRDDDRIRRYVHMGTGNYNDVTANLYTDLGLFTCKEPFGADASALFNQLTGYGQAESFRKVYAAPLGMRREFLHLIQRETEHAKAGKKAVIIAKMNSLLDPELITKLYEASSAGVKIDLIVRGICALRPGIPGVSENIRVRSIVGWLLEHSRIYYFYNDGYEEYYLSSADWMQRNLDRRVELLFPIEEDNLKERLAHMLQVFLSDNQKARAEKSSGIYQRIEAHGKKTVNCQETFYQEAKEYFLHWEQAQTHEVFVPMRGEETV